MRHARAAMDSTAPMRAWLYGGKTIYKVIPVVSPAREKIVWLVGSRPLGEY
jgi:hypothetical protein